MASVSGVVFSPQSRAPSKLYLDYIREILTGSAIYSPLCEAISGLSATWLAIANYQPRISSLEQGLALARYFPRWIATGESSGLESSMSGVVTLPLLTIIHAVQYVEYLREARITHSELLQDLRAGGAQGFCAGLIMAIVLATSKDESQLINNAAKAVRIAFAIGAYGEIGCDAKSTTSTTMVVRLRLGSEREQINREFPESYISAISDPKTISIIAPSSQITAIQAYIEALGLSFKMVHMRSNIHNLNNVTLAEELLEFCLRDADWQLPNSDNLQVPVRSNRNGQILSDCSLTAEIINTILTACCDWDTVMNSVAQDLGRAGKSHRIAMIGLGDCIPLPPFQKKGIEITKVDAMSFTDDAKGLTNGAVFSTPDSFPSNSIAVVGAACRLPGANTLEELWDLISRGESRLETLRQDRVKLEESFRASQDKDWATQRKWFGNFVDGVAEFDHGFFGISQKEAAYMDPQQRLLLTCAYEAMDASGYLHSHRRENGDPVGCFIGASYTEYNENSNAYAPSAFAATGTIRAFLSGKISYHFGWTGPSEVIDTACSASLVAVHHAVRAIQSGDCSMALAGGVNIITGIHNYIDLGRAGFLSKTGQCKPFDEAADGYCRADGVGLVVLKPLKQAIADGNHIMGVIPATATNQGGLSHGITVPHGDAQKALYRQIIKTARIEPDQVTYVESHGTGTQVGDPIEISSIREVFGGGSRQSIVHIGSLKANVGHSETAAGVASLLKVLTMFAHKGIPPQAGFKTLNPKIPALELDNMRIATDLVSWDAKLRIACVNSYGASGSNAALICAEWIAEGETRRADTSSYPVFLSAHTKDSLRDSANRLASYLQGPGKALSIGSVSFTLSQRRRHHRFRWSTTVQGLSDLTKELGSDVVGTCVEIPKTRKPVVLAFSGQSKTKVGLDPTLCDAYPHFRNYLGQCNGILRSLGYADIMASLTQTEAVTDVVALHAGTFAVQYACAKSWLDGGLQVDAVIGHSLGELTALAVSGVLSLEDALGLVAKRASLIESKWGSETGAMLAIYSDLETVQRILASSNTVAVEDRLEIACHNSPSAHVVVGKRSSIARVEKLIDSNPHLHGTRYQRLDVSHGFHSRLTEPLIPDLIKFSNTLTFNEPLIPLETCTESPVRSIAPSYIAEHSRNAVYFTSAVQRVESRLGPCIWLEAGWHTPIIPMIKKAAAKAEMHSFHSLNGSSAAVTNITAALWKQGLPVSWWAFLSLEEDPKLNHIWLPPFSFQRSRHWLDHIDRAIEVQQLQGSIQNPDGQVLQKPAQLVSFVGASGTDDEFQLFTQGEKYSKMVIGHAVRQRPLCPASMYMEAAVMCAQERGFDFDRQTIRFRNIGFHNGLGCDDSRDVSVMLGLNAESSAAGAWRFSVNSSKKDDAKSVKTKHADGQFDASPGSPDFHIYEALILDRMAALLKDPNAEHLMKRTAYALFSRVVEYADLLRGISSITLSEGQAIAEIEVPGEMFISRESTVDRFMDAISLDTFIQVLGLLINTSGKTVGDEIFVATSIENMTILPCDFLNQRRWSVYAMFGMDGDRRAVGDVFVFSAEGKLVVFGSRISFTKIQASVLEGLLDGNSPRPIIAKSQRPEGKAVPNGVHGVREDNHIATETSVHLVNTPPENPQGPAHRFADVKVLIASYIGLSASDIGEDESFSSLGLDSLSSVELADELRVKFGIEVSPTDVLTMQVSELKKGFASDDAKSTGVKEPEITKLTNGYVNGDANGHVVQASALANGRVNGQVNGHANSYTNETSGHHLEKPLKPRQYTRHRVETVTYKEIDGIQIPADIFIPLELPSEAMPIALMIHGGGHLTLSRKAIRPSQTSFLLANGILPISLDYRLCPHVNIIDGPMADVRDAYAWARKDVPLLLQEKGIRVDGSKIVVIGWSTGGHLALTTAWTTPALGLPPPLAILAFYCPTHYDPSDDSLMMGKEYQPRTMSMSEIRKALGTQTATSHAFSRTDTTGLGWLQRGDPRSELVLALVKEKNGMAILLDGIPTDGDTLQAPEPQRVAAISPLAQVQKGNYHTPTFVIIGDEDEVVPFHSSVDFVDALSKQGIRHGFIPVPGQRHIYDLTLTPGMAEWEQWVAPGYRFLFQILGIIAQ
ncbi:polyketide synthase [Trichoderma citrinoviride]|uniref:Polyketide synthase n=1 Tax=Trichoderma citrinoviride TaxID=58853 RepID=A0A2T4BLE1_9HYPO|nr:polyketide synthase [Trichoderma citrinoviride]PTB70133.1 polyketide synthase [Trichoderma citrinoviride]